MTKALSEEGSLFDRGWQERLPQLQTVFLKLRYPKDDPGPGYEDAVDCEECHPVSSHSARDQTDQEGSGAAM